MSEWLKEHAWKACVGATLPWVRIPLSPPPFARLDGERATGGKPGEIVHPSAMREVNVRCDTRPNTSPPTKAYSRLKIQGRPRFDCGHRANAANAQQMRAFAVAIVKSSVPLGENNSSSVFDAAR